MLTRECLCGTVQYQIDGTLLAMYCCHCSKCRRMCGSSFATNASLKAGSFDLTDGREHLVTFSNMGNRYHCSKCHGWLYHEGFYDQTVIIPCGTLNESPGRGIDFHCNVDFKADWVQICNGRDQYPEYPPEERLAWTPSDT